MIQWNMIIYNVLYVRYNWMIVKNNGICVFYYVVGFVISPHVWSICGRRGKVRKRVSLRRFVINVRTSFCLISTWNSSLKMRNRLQHRKALSKPKITKSRCNVKVVRQNSYFSTINKTKSSLKNANKNPK